MNESNLAKIFVIFIISVFALGLSGCTAFLTGDYFEFDLFDNNENNDSINPFEFNTTSTEDTQQPSNDYEKNSSQNTNDNSNNDKDSEILPEQEPTGNSNETSETA